MFIDTATISVCSGKGGDGAIHFRREKFVPRGGPDGGDGGKGGDIILVAQPNLNTLAHFRYKPSFKAEDGKKGGTNNKTGKAGGDLFINVPVGTIIYNEHNDEVLGDLVENEQRLVLVMGGRGGRGNARFASSKRQVPRVGERGEPGIELNIRLELKLIADVGIVGVPNAGKSTLLSAVTNAKPKIGAYPFTTIEPNLGVAVVDGETELVLADIPGLIEGAHQGVGLGHEFLRHIQRTKVIIHLLDGASDNPLLDFYQINSELALFDSDLAEKPQVVAYNKIDLPEVEARWRKFKEDFLSHAKIPGRELTEGSVPFPISALSRVNLKALLYRVSQVLEKVPQPAKITEKPLYKLDTDPQDFEINPENGGWRISGEAIERAAEMTYWEHFESIRRFQRILETLGIDEALRRNGVKVGDTIYIGGYELEWQN
jgi:GTP-binding protein